MKTPTAEEFKKQILKERGRISEYDLMIEFAKIKVTEALQTAADNADFTDETYSSMQEGSTVKIDKDSILNAYPLDNIK